jgi:hypothetical protein
MNRKKLMSAALPAVVFIPYMAYCINDRFAADNALREEMLQERRLVRQKKLEAKEAISTTPNPDK